MSSPERRSKRSPALVALALLPALALGGCFRPMYAAPSGGGPGVTEQLSAVDIDPATSRVALQIRNNLSFAFTGGAEAATPRYGLSLLVRSTRDAAIVNAQENVPLIDSVIVSSEYTLTDKATKKVLMHGKAFATKSYDRSLQRFAAVRAQRAAEDDAAGAVADQIRTRLSMYFATHPELPGTPYKS